MIRYALSLWKGRVRVNVPSWPENHPMLREIADHVAERRGIDVASSLSSSLVARQEIMFLAKETGHFSDSVIGKFLNCDRTTVAHGVRQHKERVRDHLADAV